MVISIDDNDFLIRCLEKEIMLDCLYDGPL